MESNRKSLLEAVKKPSLSAIEPSELSDICVNKGILQEVNRTFFNPLGFVLELNEVSGTLTLLKSEREGGPVIEMIDRMQLTAFRNFSSMKNEVRQKSYGFVIQTRDLLRAESMEAPLIVNAPAQRLHLLLSNLDQVAYECKQKLMQKSESKDKKLDPIIKEEMLGEIHENLGEYDWLNIMNYAAMLRNLDKINNELEKIKSRKRNETTDSAIKEQAKALGIDTSDPKVFERSSKRFRR